MQFLDPISSLKFYENAKVILVIRDPSIFKYEKRQSLSYPGHDVNALLIGIKQ